MLLTGPREVGRLAAATDVLSPLQERVAEIVASLDEATDFALAGDGALIARGDVQRQTRDLQA